MTTDEVRALIEETRRLHGELATVEVKSAAGGLPVRPVRETMSAFANAGGGVLLLGVDENAGYAVVGVADAGQLQREIADLANHFEPPLRPEFSVAEIDGMVVVAVEIDAVPSAQKPCFYQPSGLPNRAFVRVGPSNRRMTEYEVQSYLGGRTQPTFDAEPIADASLDDLDRAKLDAYLGRLGAARPQAAAIDLPFDQRLAQLGIVRQIDGVYRPTLAGLLVFGRYPQAHAPQLMITFVQYFGVDEFELTPRGERFLDNRRFEGPIDEMIKKAVDHVLSSIRRSSLIDGLVRRDIPEYPEVAIREAVVNAVAHRDYNPYLRGSYIQIRLFADRLEIQSPGGLFGGVTVETIEQEQSTRNARLIRLMEDLGLVENRGSGIRAMIRAMRQANLEPPRFEDAGTSFCVTFRNHTLMGPDTIAWLNQFAGLPLSDHQRVALGYLRHNDRLTNSDYRRLSWVDIAAATRDLRALAQLGLIAQHNAGRWTYYTLAVAAELPTSSPPDAAAQRVLAYLHEHNAITNAECRQLLDINFEQASYLLGRMYREGSLVREGKGRRTRYRLPA
ncbi:MAG: ATP-binding protein [Thermomicrobiales bacterium]